MRKSLLFQIAELPALWRMDHSMFKEPSTKRRAWEDILTCLKAKYGEELMEHQMSSVPELIGAFSTLKTRLAQEEKRHKKRTGMAANEVQQISWPFYSSMEFLREASVPLPTESSADLLDIGDGGGDAGAGESSSGARWDPRMEKQRRSLSAKEKKAWGATKVQQMQAKKHEEVLATIAVAKEKLADLGKKKEQKKKKKRDRESDNDEDEAFAKLLITQTRQVLSQLKL